MANPLIDKAIQYGKSAVDGIGNFAKRVSNTTVGDAASSIASAALDASPAGAVKNAAKFVSSRINKPNKNTIADSEASNLPTTGSMGNFASAGKSPQGIRLRKGNGATGAY